MRWEDQIHAVEAFKFTARQSRFLVTVMRHSGVCLPRQYAAFAGIAYGRKTGVFFARLVARKLASTCHCLHNRAVVYHVHHRGLYQAIGEPHSRFRRPVSMAAVVPRLMLLDAVLTEPDNGWLASEEDKVAHFTQAAHVPVEQLPQRARGRRPGDRPRYFPDGLPIGIDPSGRAVFLFPAAGSAVDDLRAFLQRHLALLAALPAWSIRLVLSRDDRLAAATYPAVLREELEAILMEPFESPPRLESHILPHRYGHLSPLVAGRRDSRPGVEKGERRGERPLRPLSTPLARPSDSACKALPPRLSFFRGPSRTIYWPCVT